MINAPLFNSRFLQVAINLHPKLIGPIHLIYAALTESLLNSHLFIFHIKYNAFISKNDVNNN